jgi:hypothetical protein
VRWFARLVMRRGHGDGSLNGHFEEANGLMVCSQEIDGGASSWGLKSQERSKNFLIILKFSRNTLENSFC